MIRSVPRAAPLSGPMPPIAALLGLVGFGDWLFWGSAPGASLALFAMATVGAAAVCLPPRRDPTAEGWAAALVLVAILPVLETAQTLSVLILILGSGAAVLVLAGGPSQPAGRLARATLRLSLVSPLATPADLVRGTATLAEAGRGGLTNAILPVGLGTVFGGLVLMANPVLSRALEGLFHADDALVLRPLLWSLLAALVWPSLTLCRRMTGLNAPVRDRRIGTTFITESAVAGSLITFNLIFAVQTSMDLTYLVTGRGLPEGMTYAEYAHRGAYPLVVAALLAGGFAILAGPFARDRPDLRILLALWLAQTAALTLGSMFRLGLYVDAYGLTHLRLNAGIWMLLVLAGLVLIARNLWQGGAVIRLMGEMATLAAATLYAVAFLNSAAVIAAVNVSDWTPEPDLHYLDSLGADAAVPLNRYLRQHPEQAQNLRYGARGPRIEGWRDWGFRSARIRATLDTMEDQNK